MFNSNLANWFFSDKRKLYTKQKGCHGVGEHLLINTPLVHFVWKMILNQRSADEPCFI